MSRGPVNFRQRDAAALIRAAKAAGLTIARVELGKDGRIVVVTAEEGTLEPVRTGTDKNEWDDAV